MSRALPSTWQAAATAAAAAGAHEQRVLVRMQIRTDPAAYLWLTQAAVNEDPDGLGVWNLEGAWDDPAEHGPFPLLRSLPDLSGQQDLSSIAAMSNMVGGMKCVNSRQDALFAALGAYRLSDLEQLGAGFTLAGQDCWIVVSYVGVPWADRVSFRLKVLNGDEYGTDLITFDLSDRMGEGNAIINSKMTRDEFPQLPPEFINSPKPIVLGGGSGPALEVREVLVVTDRTGALAVGGAIPTLRPSIGAPWLAGDRLTYGSGSARVASVAGTTDEDTVLTMVAPGVPRTALEAEGDLTTQEEGYHCIGVPAAADVPLCWADPDFSPLLGIVRHQPREGDDLVPLPGYCGTPSEPSDGVILLDKLPRFAGSLSTVWIDGDTAGSTTAAASFETLCTTKMLLDSSEYSVDSGAGLVPLKGRLTGEDGGVRVSTLRFLQQLCRQARLAIFWDGAQVRARLRRTVAEIAGTADFTLTDADFIKGFPSMRPLPVDYRQEGFTALWNPRPGRPADSANSYRGSQEFGVNASARQRDWWFDLVADDVAAIEVASFWFETLGPHSSGRWPRYVVGLVLGWEHMQLEPEDIVKLVVVDGEGHEFDGLDAGNTTLWRVVSKHVAFPQGAGEVGTVTVSLLEVNV